MARTERLRVSEERARTINPELKRFMAKRMSATTIELKASHLSPISHSDTIAKLILQAAGRA